MDGIAGGALVSHVVRGGAILVAAPVGPAQRNPGAARHPGATPGAEARYPIVRIKQILLAGGDPGLRQVLAQTLTASDFHITQVPTVQEVPARARDQRPDLLLLSVTPGAEQ